MKSKAHLRASAGTLLTLALLLIGTINLESTPPLWWDEGWILTIARNWVERGHYGPLLVGMPAPARPASGFPVVAPIALNFRLFGIGVWQGRIVGVFFLFGALALIYYLALRLYSQSVAIGTLVVLLSMSGPGIHPVLMGRQALGEMPALFYLLAGYACFLRGLQQPLWFMPLTLLFWGIALVTKLQVIPFWTVSLLLPLSMTLIKRNWRLSRLLAVALLGSLITSQLMSHLFRSLVSSETLSLSLISSFYDISILVPVAFIRLRVFIVTLLLALPMMLGVVYATWKLFENRNKTAPDLNLEVVRLAILILACSWFAWYVFLSIGWARYRFPPIFIGSIFVAALLKDLTNNFSLSYTVSCGGHALRRWRFNRESAGALLVTVLITFTSTITIRALYHEYVTHADSSALQVADFLNSRTLPNALIETYDSELFFLLNRRYHYPPDQVHVELNRRTFLGEDVAIDYDPLVADPDFLIVGPFSRMWQVYDSVLQAGEFRLVRNYSRYDVYERIR